MKANQSTSASRRPARQSDHPLAIYRSSGEFQRGFCSRRAFPATVGELGLIGIPPWIQPTT